MNCRFCDNDCKFVFLDLGVTPPSNAYVNKNDLCNSEIAYPLRLFVCTNCWLVQTEDYAPAEEFFSSNYAYFSSTSKKWLKHAADFSEMIIDRFSLNENSLVIEVASNDGYLLKNFSEKTIPCLGIEPTDSTANASEKIGISVIKKFFSEKLSKELVASGKTADLVVGNNVYAHVPDVIDFTKGIKKILKPEGVVTLEFPHLMRLLQQCQFDTVYHEHFSYFSLNVVKNILESEGLRVFDVEELSTHGGSLRVYGCHKEANHHECLAVRNLIDEEIKYGLVDIEAYSSIQDEANRIKINLLAFLSEKNSQGRKIAAYGAAAKGNTLLNYAGVNKDSIKFVCDAAPSKQGKFLPGSHIPIMHPDEIKKQRPDYVLILPWNLVDEIKPELSFVESWGGKLVTAVPKLKVL